MIFLFLVLFLLFVKCVWPNIESRQNIARYLEDIFCLPPSEIEAAVKESEQLSENSDVEESDSKSSGVESDTEKESHEENDEFPQKDEENNTFNIVSEYKSDPQSFNYTAILQMLFNNFIDIFLIYIGVPNFFWINHYYRAIITTIKTASQINSYFTLAIKL